MRTKFLAIGIASAAILSSAAQAYQAAGPAGSGPALTVPPEEAYAGALTSEDQARLDAQRVAACVVKAHRTTVLKGIELEPWQSAARRMLESALDPKCLGHAELVMPPDLLRGAYYQELYRERFASGPPALAHDPMDFGATSSQNLTDGAKADIALRQFADCVARRDLGDAHALILALPGTSQETDALRALMPQFSACLVRGSRWTLDRTSISAVLSEVLYREAVQSPAAAAK